MNVVLRAIVVAAAAVMWTLPPASAQVPAPAAPGAPAPASGAIVPAPAGAGKTDQTLLDQWREILAYGIDDEVQQALEAIDASRETALVPQMVKLIASTSEAVRIHVLDILGRLKSAAAEQQAGAILDEDPRPGENMCAAVLRYLDAIGSQGLGPAARKLVDDDRLSVAGAAVRAMRKDPSAGELLLGKLRDPRIRPELKPDMILALGELRYAPAFDELSGIAQDRSQDKVWRMYAADSLGRLGNPKAVPLLRALFQENDALLRTYAAAALGRFDEPGVGDLLQEALRDSTWRVRSAAIKALSDRRDKSAVPALIYKARRDPTGRVRLDAIAALGEIGTSEAMDTLRELFATAGSSPEIRMGSLDALLDHDLDRSVETVEKVVVAEWGRDNRVSPVVAQIAARLATRESQRLGALYERFLGSADPNVRVAGLRGAAHNRVRSLRDRIEQMSRTDPVGGVRAQAALALERM